MPINIEKLREAIINDKPREALDIIESGIWNIQKLAAIEANRHTVQVSTDPQLEQELRKEIALNRQNLAIVTEGYTCPLLTAHYLVTKQAVFDQRYLPMLMAKMLIIGCDYNAKYPTTNKSILDCLIEYNKGRANQTHTTWNKQNDEDWKAVVAMMQRGEIPQLKDLSRLANVGEPGKIDERQATVNHRYMLQGVVRTVPGEIVTGAGTSELAVVVNDETAALLEGKDKEKGSERSCCGCSLS